MNAFNDIYIGHAEKENTGVTVIFSKEGVTGGVSTRGAAPGTRETDLLRPEKTVDKVNAVVLSGGSAFGLDACSGVMRWLFENNCGFDTGLCRVPIVSGAVIYDLLPGGINFPDADTGYAACKNAVPLRFKNGMAGGINGGRAGGGRGARCGRVFGAAASMAAGIGFSHIEACGVEMAAIIVVNPLGDVFDCNTGKIAAGGRGPDGKFLDAHNFILNGGLLKIQAEQGAGRNTVIGAVVTNAKLSKLQCNMLAGTAQDGIALSVRPAHTAMDGDTIFALSAGKKEAEYNTLSVMAAEAVRLAVLNAVK